MKERIEKALKIAEENRSADGAHHKMWVIDQMVRALTGCPMVKKEAFYQDKPYNYVMQGESDEYKNWVAKICDGDEGPDTYFWDIGIPA